MSTAHDPERCDMILRRFGILLLPGVEELDFVGPWEMLRMWSLYAGGPGECLRVAETAAAQAVLSACSGAFVLHAAGLLSGRSATTHWSVLKALRELGDVQVLEQRFVRDGKVRRSAGVSADIDMMLVSIAHVAGDDTAGTVQLSAEYYPAATHYDRQAADPRAPAYVRAG